MDDYLGRRSAELVNTGMVSPQAFDAGMDKLFANLRAGVPAAQLTAVQLLWEEQLRADDWITDAIWQRAVALAVRRLTRWPPWADFRQLCEEADTDLRRDAQQAADETLAALPPPVMAQPDSSAAYAAFLDAGERLFGRRPDGSRYLETLAARQREQIYRQTVRDQAVRELKQTPKGRKFLEPFTAADLDKAERVQWAQIGGRHQPGRVPPASVAGHQP